MAFENLLVEKEEDHVVFDMLRRRKNKKKKILVKFEKLSMKIS